MVARRPATLLLFGLLLGLLLGLPRYVHAERTPAAAPATVPVSVLVLGFLEDGKPNPRLRQAAMTFLQRMGEEVVGSGLPSADQQCSQTECLVELGQRHHAQRLVGGEVTRNDSSYRILVWLYDRVSELPNSAEAHCTDCNAELLAEAVARTAGQVIEAGVSVPTPQPPPRDASRPALTTVAPARCSGSYGTFGRGVAIGSLAALTGAGLVTAAMLAGYNGKLYRAHDDGGQIPADIHYSFGTQAGLAFGLTALTAVGLTLAALPQLGSRDPGAVNCRAAPPGRATFGRGIAIGALGSLGLVGLVSGFALAGQSGSVYGHNADGSPITYDLRSHYSAAFGISTGLLAGLGLAILLP